MRTLLFAAALLALAFALAVHQALGGEPPKAADAAPPPEDGEAPAVL